MSLKDIEVDRACEYLTPQEGQKRLLQRKGTNLDYTMPGIKGLLKGWNEANGKDKLGDFVEEYWHFDNVAKQS